MPSEDIKILEFNQYQNVIKHCWLFYADRGMFNTKDWWI